MHTAQDLLKSYREKNRLLADYLCPVDQRVQNFLNRYLDGVDQEPLPRLPSQTFILDRHGHGAGALAAAGRRQIQFRYRYQLPGQTAVCYTIRPATGALPRDPSISLRVACRSPATKRRCRASALARLLKIALNPPQDLLTIPFTATQPEPAQMFVSLLMRPVVCPEIPGARWRKEHGDPLLCSRQPGQ